MLGTMGMNVQNWVMMGYFFLPEFSTRVKKYILSSHVSVIAGTQVFYYKTSKVQRLLNSKFKCYILNKGINY